jgi:hypothetical protein
VQDVARTRNRARDRRPKSGAVVAVKRKVLRHIRSVAGVDADARELADVQLEGVAV